MAIKARHKLIPALAMLVVAAVTLTSASYAWFTMSRTVTATGINLTAVAPTNLLISNEEDGTYAEKTTVTENFGTGKLIPSSSSDGLQFWAANNITSLASGAPTTTTTFTDVSTSGLTNSSTNTADGYYADFKLWLATTGEDDVKVTVSDILSYFSKDYTSVDATNLTDTTKVTNAKAAGTVTHYSTDGGTTKTAIDASYAYAAGHTFYKQGAIADAARFAILNEDGTNLITASKNNIYGLIDTVDSGKRKSNVDYFGNVYTGSGTGATIIGPLYSANPTTAQPVPEGVTVTVNNSANTNDLFTVSAITAAQIGAGATHGTPTAITVRVWIEGQDPQCITDNANTTFNFQVGFKDVNYTETALS